MEKKLDSVTEELAKVREQIKEMQEDTLLNSLKKSVSEAAERLEARCNVIKEEIFVVKTNIKAKAYEIVSEARKRGRASLNKESELFGVKEKLVAIRSNVKQALKETEVTIAKIDDFGKGIREANQQIANTFRTFADKETVDYSEKQKKFSKTEVFKKPWEVKQKLFASMELRLDAAIDKVENLSRDVEIDGMMKQYDNMMEQAHERQSLAMVAEPGEVYGDDLFEAAIAAGATKECLDKGIKPQMTEKFR